MAYTILNIDNVEQADLLHIGIVWDLAITAVRHTRNRTGHKAVALDGRTVTEPEAVALLRAGEPLKFGRFTLAAAITR